MTADELAAADSKPGDVQRWLSNTDWHALSGFAARADSFVEFEIVADHRDARQCARTISDQRRAFDRIFDLTVFNEVRLGALEDELAGGDVDLSASEINRVNAALQRTQDLIWVSIAGSHEGVGHARHRPVRIAFAAA